MTKKHFEALATALRSVKPSCDPKTIVTAKAQWTLTVFAMANSLSRMNERFDKERFVVACGVER